MTESTPPSVSSRLPPPAVPDQPGPWPAFREALSAFRLANRLIWGGGLWRYWLIPALLAVAYLPVLAWAVGAGGSWLADHMRWGATEGSWTWWLWRLLWWSVLGVIGILSYRGVVLLFHAPFLDAISERVERELEGRDLAPAMQWLPMALRSLRMGLGIALLSGFVALLNFAVSLIPLLGLPLSILVFLPLQFWIGGVQAVDPTFGRSGLGVRSTWKAAFQGRWRTLALGGIGAAILVIPVFGWFVGPTYLVVAGVILGRPMLPIQADPTQRKTSP